MDVSISIVKYVHSASGFFFSGRTYFIKILRKLFKLDQSNHPYKPKIYITN